MKTRCLALCALFCAVSLALTACGTGRTMVLEPGESRKLNSITVAEGQSTVTVSSEAGATFKNKLNELLYTKGGFRQGPEVSLTYRFLQFNEGSRFERWFTGGIGNSGEGSLTIEVVYSDKSGKQVGKIMSEGKIGSGFFGGSSNNAIDKAAEEIASYSIAHFK